MTSNIGVYALRHRASRSLYVGSSFDLKSRKKRWRKNMRSNPQNVPPELRRLSLDPDDWDFVVLWHGQPTLTPEALRVQEARATAQVLQRAPERCLNRVRTVRADAAGLTVRGHTQSLNAWSRETGTPRATISSRLDRGWTPEQAIGADPLPVRDRRVEHIEAVLDHAGVVVMDEGQPLTCRQAAEKLSCQRDTLRERLRKYRVPGGQARVQLSELRELSEKYRR